MRVHTGALGKSDPERKGQQDPDCWVFQSEFNSRKSEAFDGGRFSWFVFFGGSFLPKGATGFLCIFREGTKCVCVGQTSEETSEYKETERNKPSGQRKGSSEGGKEGAFR